MRVLAFSPYAAWSPHWETDLEVMEGHRRAGDDVTVVACDHELESCDPNWNHARHACLKCVSRRREGMRSLSPGVAVRSLTEVLTDDDRRRIDRLQCDFRDHESLKRYWLDEFDIGYAVLSSLITWHRDAEVDLARHADVMRRLLRSSCAAYLSMRRIIRETRPDRLYLFNGRLAVLRAALRAGQSRGVDVHVTEVGCDPGHYAVYENTLPHDIPYVDGRIREAWDRSPHDVARRRSIADDWYLRRARGVVSNDKGYTRLQDAGSLPQQWDDAAHNVAVFTSSEDEFSAIGDHWRNPMFADQAEGIRRVVEATARRGARIYVRVHPNLTGIDNRSTSAIRSIDAPHVTVLAADSTHCSYELMRRCDTTLTFGSTMGIEAAYWGKPSVLVGHSFYENLNATYNPRDMAELTDLLLRPLEAPAADGALRYGYYWATFGQPYRHYRSRVLGRGEFNGREIRPPWLTRMSIRGWKLAASTSRRVNHLWCEVRRRAA